MSVHMRKRVDDMSVTELASKYLKVLARNRLATKRHAQKLKDMGVCVHFGCGEPANGGVHCQLHRAEMRHRMSIRSAERLAAGQCRQCTSPIDPRNKSFCTQHRLAHNASSKKSRQKSE